jgi:hypothetical protein
VGYAFPDRQHFHPKLVPGNSRIGEKGHFTEIPRIIGSADADAMNLDERFSAGRLRRLVDVNAPESVGFLELNGFHYGSVPTSRRGFADFSQPSGFPRSGCCRSKISS